LTFVNIIWFFAVVTLFIGISALTAIYIGPFLAALGPFVLEILAYLVTSGVSALGVFWSDNYSGVFLCLLGNLCLVLTFTYSLHRFESKNSDNGVAVIGGFSALTFGISAILCKSSLLGLISIFGLEALCGFLFIPNTAVYVIGFRNSEAIAKVMVNFIKLHPYVFLDF
jgi:hypothetical protein